MTDDAKKKAETRAKLKAFLQGGGHPDDVSSVLVHTLMEHAENRQPQKPAKAPKPKKK